MKSLSTYIEQSSKLSSLDEYIKESLSNAEHEKFMEAVDNYFTILSKEVDNKKEFIKRLRHYSDREIIKYEWEEFVDAVLDDNKELHYKLSYAKIMKDPSLIYAVIDKANQWIESWEEED